jgi:very-short-patch-repair endonuclease
LKNLNSLAKNLRKIPTEAEKLLWNYLKANQIEGFKFRRQQPIDNYIVDFVYPTLPLTPPIEGGEN